MTTTATQNGANIRAIAMSIQPASGGMTLERVLGELGAYKDSGGTNALPSAWSAATVADKDGNSVLAQSVFTVAAHGSLPDANDPLDQSGVVGFDTYAFATLAALKADGTYGDGNTPTGGEHTTGEYVVLGNGTKAHYASAAWSAGAKS